MTLTIDPHSGFCFGVTHAIEVAEQQLKDGGSLFCLGEIVHNDMEVKRLKELGLIIIDFEQFKSLHNCKVLLRAHGEPPETYSIAHENHIELIDASCPIVLNLQNDILRGYREMQETGGQVVIYGKKGHAEINGLKGQTDGNAIIIEGANDLGNIDFSHPVRLYSQTTMGKKDFQEIKSLIGGKIINKDENRPPEFIAMDTTCGQVSGRASQLQEFAARFDCIIFVSSRKSSNGMFLYELCKKINPRTHLVSGTADLDLLWFKPDDNVGICGATSTPMWLMQETAEEIKKINI